MKDNYKILVIDDEESVRKSFDLSLEDTGYHVDTADTGHKGLEYIKNNSYNLIFLDLKMPGLNGVETLKLIRKIDTDVPIYIITAFHREYFNSLDEVRKQGLAFELLHKPINDDQIRMVVNSVVQGPIAY